MKDINIEKIIKETAKKWGITPQLLTSKDRTDLVVQARREAIYRLHKETKLSYRSIAYILGKKNVSTIIYHLKKLDKERLN